MKKIFAIILAVCMFVSCITTLTACNDEAEHTHDFASAWSKDQTHHWLECKTEGCDGFDKKGEHVFNWVIDKQPSVTETGLKHEECECGYTRNEQTTIEKLPSNDEEPKPTPTPSVNLSKYLEIENVTINETETISSADMETPIVSNSIIKVVGDKWLEQNESFGSKTNVYFDGTNAYGNGEITTDYAEPQILSLVNLLASKESSFTKRSDNEYFAQTLSLAPGYAYNDVAIVISQEKLDSISYYFESEGIKITYAYSFSNWAQTVINGEEYTTPSIWRTYFEWENVTIHEALYNGSSEQPSSIYREWKINGNAWYYFAVTEAVDNVATKTVKAYFDGVNSYLNDELTIYDEIEYYHYEYEDIYVLKDLEDKFTKTEQGNSTVYTAQSIDLYGIINYLDVKITVTDGKIQEITYTDPDGTEVEGEICSLTYTFTFTNWGTTSIGD